jgi:hypothetical protein
MGADGILSVPSQTSMVISGFSNIIGCTLILLFNLLAEADLVTFSHRRNDQARGTTRTDGLGASFAPRVVFSPTNRLCA